jgi:hypothetical protein
LVFLDKGIRNVEAQRLLELTPEYQKRYVVRQGDQGFRIDTLDQDLRVVGIRFVSISSPQVRPTPETDSVHQEYFQLKNGLYLRAQWGNGQQMFVGDRAKAQQLILAHEARLRAE